jgi:hypothetical protein
MTPTELQIELAKMRLRSTGAQFLDQCAALRRKIAEVEHALAHEPEKGPRYG